jgi:hypothetical protein
MVPPISPDLSCLLMVLLVFLDLSCLFMVLLVFPDLSCLLMVPLISRSKLFAYGAT